MKQRFFSGFALVISLCLNTGARAQSVEVLEGFVVETLAMNLNAATALTVAPDGRIFIADQTGPLRVWKEGRLLPSPALDLSGRVDDYWERGLIGVTLHPDFPYTPHLFVVYVAKEPYPHHVVSRFTLLGDVADPASEFVLLEGDDQRKFGGSVPHGHQGGPIRFGPDGKIYIGLGEQTAGRPSQSLEALQGKILRINPDGSIPADNPFFEKASGKYRAIWALGIRNPFGLAFQPETGRLFVSDVGASAWEEINEIKRGGNYGWPEAEGFSTNTAFENPVYSYPPAIGRSIVGAAFYPRTVAHGGGFPEKWRGKFFFADWAANWIKALDPESPTNVMTFAKGLNAPATIELGPDGSLLVLNRGTIWRDGKKWEPDSGSLLRIRYAGGTLPDEVNSPAPLARTLRETGLFESVDPMQLEGQFTEFVIIHPPWRPGIKARRWIALPPRQKLRITQDREFEFPAGSAVVQHFMVEKTGAPLETHVFWFDVADRHSRIARAAAYRWEAGEASLVEDSEIIELPGHGEHRWFSPGAERRLNLDMTVAGFTLALSPRQLSRETLQEWNGQGWLEPKLDSPALGSIPLLASVEDESAPAELRVRSYLDVNCAACHRPGGPSRGNFDARLMTPLHDQNIIHGELAAGHLELSGARVVVPGVPESSVLLERLKRNDAFRMPPVSVNDDPQPILPVLREWIEGLDATVRNQEKRR